LLQGLAQDALVRAAVVLAGCREIVLRCRAGGERAEQQRRKKVVAIHKEMVSEQNNSGHACRDHSKLGRSQFLFLSSAHKSDFSDFLIRSKK
jgi:hypothetical protein